MNMNGFGFSLRRQRMTKHIRQLSSSFSLDHKQFIQPIFVNKTLERHEFALMPGVFMENEESVIASIADDIKNGVTKFLLFTSKSSDDFAENMNFTKHVISTIKKEYSDSIFLMADVCLCTVDESGHCGVLNENHDVILNHESVGKIADLALEYVTSGADAVAPSDMMDGRILAIRTILDDSGFGAIPIMSYSTKFASAFYGPFREACNSVPKSKVKDRLSYQISHNNLGDALRCSMRDESEGADILMVKPAIAYLDIIARVSENTHLPVAAYHVSGEYYSLELLAKNTDTPRELLHLECWKAIRRAGATIIISYAARHAKDWILGDD